MSGVAMHRRRLAAALVLALAAGLLVVSPVRLLASHDPVPTVPTAQLVADVNTTGGNRPSGFTEAGGTVFFVADDTIHGPQLWRTDGTAAGTRMVRHVPGDQGGGSQLTNLNGTLFFVGFDHIGGVEVWKSDGTADGTVRVTDIAPGVAHSNPEELNVVGNWLFFTAGSPTHGRALWKTDGTTTALVKDPDPGTGHSQTVRDLNAVGNLLYFGADDDGTFDSEPWVSDGTTSGTVLLKELNPTGPSYPDGFVEMGGGVYFTAFDGTDFGLWKTDGTGSGTVLVANPGINGPLTVAGGRLYFAARPSFELGMEPWTSDGTTSGTALLKDVYAGGEQSWPGTFTELGGAVYFTADDGSGYSLWRTNGTEAGTVRIADVGEGESDHIVGPLHVLGGRLFFSAGLAGHGNELWASDGTTSGTALVVEVGPGRAGIADEIATGLGRLWFAANDGATGVEPWSSDGTALGTSLLLDIGHSSAQAFYDTRANFTPLGNLLFFTADDGIHGIELWVTDRSTGLTHMVKDVFTEFGSNPRDLTVVNGKLYFTAERDPEGRELWVSDGTEAGTQLVKDINDYVSYPGYTDSSDPRGLTVFGGYLWFSANSPTPDSDNELWRTDGTASGTVQVANINPTGSSFPQWLTSVGGTLYLSAADGTHGEELWMTTGTSVALVADIRPIAGSQPWDLTAVGNRLFFSADDGTSGREPWVVDGSGAHRVADVHPDGGSSEATAFAGLGSNVVFAATDGTHGYEPWKLDSSGSVSMLRDITDADGYAYRPEDVTVVGSTVFFSAGEQRQLWKTDGTTTGTVLVSSVAGIDELHAFGTSLVFTAMSGLWSSDGTASGTAALVTPPGLGYQPQDLAVVGNAVYYTADDGVHGREPLAWPPDFDGDGLFNDVDLAPLAASSAFSDRDPTQATAGVVVSVPNGLRARVADNPAAGRGVNLFVTSTGPSEPGAKVRLDIDGKATYSRYGVGTYVVTDPPATTIVETLVGGPAELVYGDGAIVVVVDAGEAARVTETFDSQAGETIVTVAAVAGTITVNGDEVTPDDGTVTPDPTPPSTLTSPRLRISTGRRGSARGLDVATFELSALFAPGTSIDPLAEDVVLHVGAYTTTIDAPAFKRDKKGKFVFVGAVGGVALDVQLAPTTTGGAYTVRAVGKGVDLTGTENPVEVGFGVGTDTAIASVTATFG